MEMFQSNTVTSDRSIYTASAFSRSNLLYLQEVGTLKANEAHTSSRQNLSSYLFFTVLSGEGEIVYGGSKYLLYAGDCVFIDCRIPYSHSTSNNLWSLAWVHFNGAQMDGIYEKYKNRGGKVVFQSTEEYQTLLKKIKEVSKSSSYVRDMELSTQLSHLLVLLMKDAWNPDGRIEVGKKHQIGEIRSFIDENYNTPITLELLSNIFYINKTYLAEIFKEQYGVGVNEYLIEKRITKAKEMLRFTEMTMDEIAEAIGVNGTSYFSRMFKKTEGISPRKWRNVWNSNK